MTMSKAEMASLEALRNGASLSEALALLPSLTAEQLALLDAESAAIQAIVSGEPLTLKLLEGLNGGPLSQEQLAQLEQDGDLVGLTLESPESSSASRVK